LITIPDKVNHPSLPNWTEFGKLITPTPDDVLSVAHKTVETRLAFANIHLTILRQVNNNTLKRAMFENIVINLISSLQSVAHEINEYYSLGINYRRVQIDHQRHNRQKECLDRVIMHFTANHFLKDYKKEKKQLIGSKTCLRCKLKTVNVTLAERLDGILITSNPEKHWYAALIEYRHQIVHRQHFIAKVIVNYPRYYFLADDPRIIQPTERARWDNIKKRAIWPNYTQMRDIKKFSEDCYKKVVIIIEGIYELMLLNKR
jgi:hypothetical protein